MIGIVMGSESDWEVMKGAAEIIDLFQIPYECKVVSAHRTPDLLFKYAEEADARLFAIIAGAGGAAHLPGMLAAKTPVPVVAVPVQSKAFNGLDSLLSIVQMPDGIPVATMAVNGAANAGLFVGQMLARTDKDVARRVRIFREHQTERVLKTKLPDLYT